MDHQFRNAVFGGFNRQDVLDYLETLARENAQKRQELEQSIGRAEGERDELRAQKQALEEQKRALEGEKEELLRSVQRSQSELAALPHPTGRAGADRRQTQQALEESRREAGGAAGAGGPAGAGRGCLRRGEGPLRRGGAGGPPQGPGGAGPGQQPGPAICASRWSSG